MSRFHFIYTIFRGSTENWVEKELVKQLNELFQKVALSDDCKEKFMKQWERDYKEASTASFSSAGEYKQELKQLEEKQMRLLILRASNVCRQSSNLAGVVFYNNRT